MVDRGAPSVNRDRRVCKRGVALEDAYQSLKQVAYPWLIRRWAEAKGADGLPLVRLVPHVVREVQLEYNEGERDRMNTFLEDLKESKKGHVATFIHEYWLAYFAMDLPGNDTVLNSSGEFEYRKTWDAESLEAGPAVRWLSSDLMPILLSEGENGLPNKAVIFNPLPGQAWYIFWFLTTFHPQLKTFNYHSGLPRSRRTEMIEEFSRVDQPAAIILTPAMGGTGLILVAANHAVIM